MTWILAKLGLSLAEGKTLLPIAAVLAAAAALISIGLYTVHHFTSAGYDKAIAECNAARLAALFDKHKAESKAAETNTVTLIEYVTDDTKLSAAIPTMKEEVANYVEKNPAVVLACNLSPDGLRIWNADPIGGRDAPVQIQPEPAPAQPGQSPPDKDRNTAGLVREPGGQQGGLQEALAQTSRPLERSARLFAIAGDGSADAAQEINDDEVVEDAPLRRLMWGEGGTMAARRENSAALSASK